MKDTKKQPIALKKKWKIKPKASKNFKDSFPEYSDIILNLLFNRLPHDQKAIDEFFNPDYAQDIHDPFLFSDMEKSVKRILEAIKNKEKIAVYGDYDVDGITSSTIISSVLKELKAKPIVYIPDRRQEGYSLNKNALKYLHENEVSLIITVDCGIRDIEEVEKAKKWGIDVIITDHHLPGDELPKSFSIINPKVKGENFPSKDLAGVGVAFKLASAIIQKSPKVFKKGSEKWYLDLVALGTIADMVPLLGENRTLVKYGLIVLSKTRRKGIRAIFSSAGIPLDLKKIPTTQQIGFQIAPRLNASGRMDHANSSFILLNSDSLKVTEKLAQELEIKNSKRQKVTEKVFKEIEENVDLSERVIFQGSPDWPVGILGLAAGKICEKFARPAFIFNEGEDKCRGSIRSIKEFKVVDVLEMCRENLLDYGGHDFAGGFSFEKTKKENLAKALIKIANEKLSDDDLVWETLIDARINLTDIDWKLHEDILKLEPFGMGNPTPVFLAEKVELFQCQVVGNGNKHLKMWFKEKETIFEGIAFGKGEKHCQLISTDNPKLDIIFEIQSDEWNGNKRLQLFVRDLRISPK